VAKTADIQRKASKNPESGFLLASFFILRRTSDDYSCVA
jgi:hypothetical protein